jgi:3-deoxy-D-manno-octulosonic-acid transferase
MRSQGISIYPIYHAVTSFLHPIVAEPILRLRRYVNSNKEDIGDDHIRYRLGKWNNKFDQSFPPFNTLSDTATVTYWFHAASVGESLSTIPLLSKLLDRSNKNNSNRVVLSIGTHTGRRATKMKLEEITNINMKHILIVPPPIDTPQAVNGFLSYFQPTKGIMMESELWPNYINITKSKNIPLFILNGRLSNKSYNRWYKYKAGQIMLHDMITSFDTILSQSEMDTIRYNKVISMNHNSKEKTIVHTIPNIKMASTTSYLRDANCSNGSSGGGSSSSSLWKKRVHASNNLYRSFNNNDNDDNRKVLNILIASTHKGEESLIASIFNDIGTQHRVIICTKTPRKGK